MSMMLKETGVSEDADRAAPAASVNREYFSYDTWPWCSMSSRSRSPCSCSRTRSSLLVAFCGRLKLRPSAPSSGHTPIGPASSRRMTLVTRHCTQVANLPSPPATPTGVEAKGWVDGCGCWRRHHELRTVPWLWCSFAGPSVATER
jgi:hypothetical protein